VKWGRPARPRPDGWHPDQLYITRAQDWRKSGSDPISQQEWERLAGDRADLAVYDPADSRAREDYIAMVMARDGIDRVRAEDLVTRIDRQREALARNIEKRPDLIARHKGPMPALRGYWDSYGPAFAIERGDGTRIRLSWFDSRVAVSNLGSDRAADVARVLPIAKAIGAHLVDDEGTVYE
jgi:hypothetical protein